MGARFAVTGGRDGWTRAVLTAVGVGLGVALLLLAAAVPGALAARQARGDARDDLRRSAGQLPAAADTLLVGQRRHRRSADQRRPGADAARRGPAARRCRRG